MINDDLVYTVHFLTKIISFFNFYHYITFLLTTQRFWRLNFAAAHYAVIFRPKRAVFCPSFLRYAHCKTTSDVV